MTEDRSATRDRPEILALIPARGGSKGVPRKNVRDFGGIPLLAWSLRDARAVAHRVVVSTDDDEIAAVARRFDAEVVERPPSLAGDTASSESALLHALDALRNGEGYTPDIVLFLQATSPLRGSGDLPGAIDRFVAAHAAKRAAGGDGDDVSLFSAGPVHGFVWRRLGDDAPRALTYDPDARPRRQDIGEDLLENGSFYLFTPEGLRRRGNRLGPATEVWEMDPLLSLQIDEPGDLGRLAALLPLLPSASRAPSPEALAAVRLLVLDFDGVLTDNRVLVDQDGGEAVLCHRGDGMGLAHLRQAGIEARVLSKERNPVVAARCRKLNLPFTQSLDDKLPVLRGLAAERGLHPEQVAYVGNDVNDLPCLVWAGIAAAPADAVGEARAAARWVTTARGGHGAVREICDALLAARDASGAAPPEPDS